MEGVEDAHSTPIPPLGVVEGTALTEKCSGGSVRDRFLAFPRRQRASRVSMLIGETMCAGHGF